MKANRRKFIEKIGLGTGLLAAGGLLDACIRKKERPVENSKFSGESITWQASTTWPPHFPVLGEGIDLFAEQVEKMSGGRLKIKVFGAGEVVPAFELFDAVSQGTVEVGHGGAYYWTGKIPASGYFSSVPFGFNAQQMNAWLIGGDGMKLWEKLYEPYGVLPIPAGNTGVQMGGWFNKEIKSLADLQGLKIRMPGLGGKVISNLGASAVQIAGGEIYTSLERGVIDAAEWIGPYHDYKMGFHKAAKFYYYPGWHETGTTLELLINKKALFSLSEDLQEIVKTAAYRANLWMLCEFEAKNNFYLQKIRSEGNTVLKKFPDEVLKALKASTDQIMGEIAKTSPIAKEIDDSFRAFKKSSMNWNALSEEAILPYLK